jgi:NADH-quinone oxidoreductase subunit L
MRGSPKVVTVPLVLLAIPSVLAGYLVGWVVFGDYFGGAIVVHEAHDVLGELAADYHGVWGFVLHGMMAPPFWLALAGIATAWVFFHWRPELAEAAKRALRPLYVVLDRKYGFDELYLFAFAGGARQVGRLLWQWGDARLIDGLLVNGTARTVGWVAERVRGIQTGYLYHYAFAMIIGLILLLARYLYGG